MMDQSGLPVKIITDSVSQIPSVIASKLDISTIPFNVTVGESTYQDGVDLRAGELYRWMRVEKMIPKTSAPPPGRYRDAMLKCIKAGARSLFCPILSSNLSVAINSIKEAAELTRQDYPDVPIEIFDTKQAAIAEGYIAIEAAKAAAQGLNLDQVHRVAKEAQKRAGIVVAFETLEYLALGGRIGKAAYLLGNLIDIKPIITLDKDGLVTPLGRVRGTTKAFEAIVSHVKQVTKGRKFLNLAIMDADAPDQAHDLEVMSIEILKPDDILHTSITPVMGAHTGPGLVGLGYYYT